MKLSDEKVAKALGWKLCRGYTDTWEKVPGHLHQGLPHYTTSLDAITAEIEARGLEIHLHKWPAVKKWPARWQADIEKDMARVTNDAHYAPTAPLALCAALLAYLKEKP